VNQNVLEALPILDENVLTYRLYVRIPNDDVVDSDIRRVTSLGGLEIASDWRSNDSWEQLEDKAVATSWPFRGI
jgi:hypothetical protein